MDHAEVDLADGVRVVVEEADDAHFIIAGDVQFLVDLALHGGVVGGSTCAALAHVHRIDVTADADRNFRMQPVFAARLAARVVQDSVAAFKNAIWDELLVARIVLCGCAIEEKVC